MKDIQSVPFRKDEYGMRFFVEENDGIKVLPMVEGKSEYKGIALTLARKPQDGVLHISVDIVVNDDIKVQRCGLRLGIDTYMDKYPDWNGKYFPTALRCEKNGFWGCFCSPEGDMLAIASPSQITSWSNEYNKNFGGDVGHRIYTSAVDFVNCYDLPSRHIVKKEFVKGESLHYDIYLSLVEDRKDLYAFVKKYAKITVPYREEFILEKDNTELGYGRHIISKAKEAETSVYVRRDWFYYMDMARKDAERSQQKPGTHVESWYGFYTLAAFAKIIKDEKYTEYVRDRFDAFLLKLTKKSLFGHIRMKKQALPHRLQNVSGMLSLLADMYELTRDDKYLDYAKDFADFLMSLQAKDGSYRSHGVHYTCVIYPAKSMTELALTERQAGRTELADIHFASAKRAVEDLYKRLDDIGTEGQMTFEDGMISCEALQLAYIALQLQGEEREKYTKVAEYIIKKHACLEQKIIPDCRTYGATLRFWEARYDINFMTNMLNTPHGWTSWKNYATYYLYMLTGKKEYLLDTVNTLGACMQTIDDKGELKWAFVPDPFVKGRRMVKADNELGIELKEEIIGECYLEKVSDWYIQPEGTLPMQYIRNMNRPSTWKKDLGGSCDNDVHEHFKCLDETLFGKAFVHIENGEPYLVNCKQTEKGYVSDDKYVNTFVVYSDKSEKLNIQGKEFEVGKGITACKL